MGFIATVTLQIAKLMKELIKKTLVIRTREEEEACITKFAVETMSLESQLLNVKDLGYSSRNQRLHLHVNKFNVEYDPYVLTMLY
jgi:hypothetical protein